MIETMITKMNQKVQWLNNWDYNNQDEPEGSMAEWLRL